MEISVTDSDEVLVARMVSGPTIPSSVRKSSCFSGQLLDDRLDHELAVLDLAEVGGEVIRSNSAVLVLLRQLPALDRPVRRVLDVLAAALERVVVQLDTDHLVAVAGEDLGDAGAHGAESDHADGGGFTGHGRIMARPGPRLP